jgi:hypothetical protein
MEYPDPGGGFGGARCSREEGGEAQDLIADRGAGNPEMIDIAQAGARPHVQEDGKILVAD